MGMCAALLPPEKNGIVSVPALTEEVICVFIMHPLSA